MHRFKLFLLWVLMVLVLTALMVGGVLFYFYQSTAPGDSAQQPLTVETVPAEGTKGESVFVKPDGYVLNVPVLSGVLHRNFSADALGAQQTVVWNETAAVSLTPPEGGTVRQIEVTKDGGVLFADAPEAYSAFSYPESGSYQYQVEVTLPPAEEGDLARESGTLTYRFTVEVSI